MPDPRRAPSIHVGPQRVAAFPSRKDPRDRVEQQHVRLPSRGRPWRPTWTVWTRRTYRFTDGPAAVLIAEGTRVVAAAFRKVEPLNLSHHGHQHFLPRVDLHWSDRLDVSVHFIVEANPSRYEAARPSDLRRGDASVRVSTHRGGSRRLMRYAGALIVGAAVIVGAILVV